MENKAQVTIFIIIAIILIAGVVSYFALRGKVFQEKIPANVQPIYNTFLSCLEENVLLGIDILQSQGGYIYLPEFEPGSDYMPFSSQLNFAGNPIPYWYYVSQNNIQKEQAPFKSDMQEQLEQFIEEKITNCRFDIYYEQGFEINKAPQDEIQANVKINDNNVEVNLNMQLDIKIQEQTTKIKTHNLQINSRLGKLYDNAKKIYDYEQDTLFLEEYGIDVLRLYAPVDGVELSCSPETWIADNVFNELQNAIEANTLALKTKGGDYNLKNKQDKYFIVDVSADSDVRFINSKNWPYSFEVNPSEGNVLIANPVGNQPGLGILGFCYVPYHFVYNARYPVLVQVSYGNEIFQFPVAIVIQGNKPRQALEGSAFDIELPELCNYKNTLVDVNVYDTKLSSINAEISFECFGTKCNIGKTENGNLNSNFPQCANGYVLARAKGFVDGKSLFSTTQSGSIDIFLDKLYNLNLNLKLDARDYNGKAIVSFNSDKDSKTIVYPEQKTIELAEGQYEVSVYIYRDSNLKIAATTKQQCVEVPSSGIGGIFGFTKEKCFDITLPEQLVSDVLAGGGKQNYYVVESELQDSRTIEIHAQGLPLPRTIEQLQDNYILFEEKGLGVEFR